MRFRRGLVKDITDAERVLVHESVHHFGFEDERFPDDVAKAIDSLGTDSSCPVTPAQAPFDPASCPGNALSASELETLIPLPASNSIELGSFRFHARSRTCYREKWCGPWKAEDTGGFCTWYYTLQPFVGWQPHAEELPRAGKVFARFENDIPEVVLDAAQPGVERKWRMRSTLSGHNLKQLDFWYSKNTSYENLRTADGIAVRGDLFSGKIARHCVRQHALVRWPDKDNLNNTITRESELVVLSHF